MLTIIVLIIIKTFEVTKDKWEGTMFGMFLLDAFILYIIFHLLVLNAEDGRITCADYGLVSGPTSIHVQDKKVNGITQAKYIRTECRSK